MLARSRALTSPLFPYTTLFRSYLHPAGVVERDVDIRDGPCGLAEDAGVVEGRGAPKRVVHGSEAGGGVALDVPGAGVLDRRTVADPELPVARSEGHTSELQSPYDLVCRRVVVETHRTI